MTPDPSGTIITILHTGEGELTFPKKTEPASGKVQTVTRPLKMQAHSQMVLRLADGSFNSTAWMNASHCGQSVALGWGLSEGVGAGKSIAANGDEIFFDTPTMLRGIITGGTGRFAGASGEFNVEVEEQTGMDLDPAAGTVTLSFVWTAMGTITY